MKFFPAAAAAALAACTIALPSTAARTDYAEASRAPAAKKVPRPARNSLEYRLSWGLRAINADAAYRRGKTGDGVLVALIDTGTSFARDDLAANIAPASIDLVERADGSLPGRHGTQVGDLLAAGLDGSGTVGVAYRSRLLSIRADIDGSCATTCAIRATDLSRAIDYAVDKGARVIAMPLVGRKRLPSIEPALRRAVESGAVMVVAAGNDGGREPSWPARYAADPGLARGIIVAGASRADGRLASWSNRAGSTADRFLAAPGENVLTNCDDKVCYRVSGTSYSVAFAAGALALLMEQRPELDAQRAAALLLERGTTLSGMGRVADDTGRGRIDMRDVLRARATS